MSLMSKGSEIIALSLIFFFFICKGYPVLSLIMCQDIRQEKCLYTALCFCKLSTLSSVVLTLLLGGCISLSYHP